MNAANFGINTVLRMSHFLGQIGHESGGFKAKNESGNYPPRRIVKFFARNKYGHLFEQAVPDSATCTYTYVPVNYDENNCSNDAMVKGSSSFSLTENQKRNAYASRRNQTVTYTYNGAEKQCSAMLENRKGITKNNIKDLVEDKSYNQRHIRVKARYINSLKLFDVTYGCRMGNGCVSSHEGLLYRGRRYIQITSKDKYIEITNK